MTELTINNRYTATSPRKGKHGPYTVRDLDGRVLCTYVCTMGDLVEVIEDSDSRSDLDAVRDAVRAGLERLP